MFLGMVIVGLLVRRVERLYRLAPASSGLAAVPYEVLMVALALLLPITDVTGVLIFTMKYLVFMTALLWLVKSASKVRPTIPRQRPST